MQPQIFLDFPERDEELRILRENLPFAHDEILEYVTDFLQLAHASDERYTVRDGINIARYSMRLLKADEYGMREAIHTAVEHTLGDEAMRYARAL